MKDRRDPHLSNRVRRRVWPAPVDAAVFGLRVAPAAVAVLMISLVAWSTVPALYGFLPSGPVYLSTAAVAAGVTVRPRWRGALIPPITVALLGASMTFLLDGSSSEVYPRSAELLAASIFGNLWIIYVACHIATEAALVAACVDE